MTTLTVTKPGIYNVPNPENTHYFIKIKSILGSNVTGKHIILCQRFCKDDKCSFSIRHIPSGTLEIWTGNQVNTTRHEIKQETYDFICLIENGKVQKIYKQEGFQTVDIPYTKHEDNPGWTRNGWHVITKDHEINIGLKTYNGENIIGDFHVSFGSSIDELESIGIIETNCISSFVDQAQTVLKSKKSDIVEIFKNFYNKTELKLLLSRQKAVLDQIKSIKSQIDQETIVDCLWDSVYSFGKKSIELEEELDKLNNDLENIKREIKTEENNLRIKRKQFTENIKKFEVLINHLKKRIIFLSEENDKTQKFHRESLQNESELGEKLKSLLEDVDTSITRLPPPDWVFEDE